MHCEEGQLVLAMGPGNLPVVWGWTAKTGQFGSRPIQICDPQLLGRRHLATYPSNGGFCRVWLDPAVPITGSGCQVFLFMVTLRYSTVNCNILTLVHHCPFVMLWLPFYSRKRDTRTLRIPENESQRSVNDFSSCILGILSGDWLQICTNEV